MPSIHLTHRKVLIIDIACRKFESSRPGIDGVASSAAWRWPEFAIDSLILRLVVLHEGALVYRTLIRLCMIEFWLDIDTYDLATSWTDRVSIISHFAYSISRINRSIAAYSSFLARLERWSVKTRLFKRKIDSILIGTINIS